MNNNGTNYNTHPNNGQYHKTGIIVSIIALVVAFVFGDFFTWVVGVFSIAALVFAIYKFRIIRTKKAGWSIAIASLAILISILNVTNFFYAKKYANETAKRITKELAIEIPDIKPEHYYVAIVDGQLIRRVSPLIYNEVIYRLENEDFEKVIAANNKFSADNLGRFKEDYSLVVMQNADVSLVVEVADEYFGLNEMINSSNYVIINYKYDSKVLQIVEIVEME